MYSLSHVSVTLVSILVLLAAALPATTMLRDASFRALFPGPARLLLVAVFGWGATVATLAVLTPRALLGLALLTLILFAMAAWRSRPAYGRSRRLPPGSLSLTSAMTGLADREFYARRAARHGPVFKTSQLTKNVVCVVGLERGQRLLRQNREVLGPNPLPFTHDANGGFLRYMDDETHDLYGSLFRRALNPEVLRVAETVTRAAVVRELGALPATVDALAREAASPDQQLERIAYDTLACALFGLRRGCDADRAFRSAFVAFSDASIALSLPGAARRALAELREVVRDQLVESDNGDSPIPEPNVLTELRRLDPRMPDTTCIDNLLFMLKIGTDNTTGLLRWLVAKLGQNPDWRARLSGGPEVPGGRSDREECPHQEGVADAFILETLRLSQSEYIYRRLLQDVDFEGYLLPRGWLVRLCVAESHRDPDIFPDPGTFSDRFVDHRPESSELCPFGFGRHSCNGVGLVFLVSRCLLRELAQGPEMVVYGADRSVRDLRFAGHWRPGPRLEVVFRSRP